ncbi:MAG: hypothetical protein LBI60_00185 [Bacteroidales bacterium]|jgi:tetratricopeptide (TPR) repeat protein|nr:hypothetical protein [Bacteroidales bacterium]
MSYLVLHIDVEFIIGAVCADNGTSLPITNGNEELLWLYFFNNPHQNSITFGKDNKAHFNNSEVNYYGNFFEKIEREQETFMLRGIEHPIIDLLKESGLFENIRKTYQQKTLDNAENIPTLLTFSSSIGDNAKQKTVDYLKNNGFQIDSYTIPLSELVSYHALNNKSLKVGNGSVAIFLEATNPTLHLMKLSLSDNYFLMDGKPQTHEGMGFDPRKLALLRFVVNEANKSIGALFSENEKIEECKRLEIQADEWLKKLDATSHNIPYNIRAVSFSKMPSCKKDILVRKSDLDSDTGAYTQSLKNIFDVFCSDNVRSDVAVVFLLGDCFKSDRVKSSFEQMIGKDKLYFYANKDIQDILTMYPKIDITRYANEEERIKKRSKAEEQKQAEQRALEDKQRKEQEEEDKRQAEIAKAEQNHKDAQKLFERAIELKKEGKLQDALTNIENAIEKGEDNTEYKRLHSAIKDKLNELKIRTEQYKSLLNKAEKFIQSKDFESALNVYELAKELFDNAEIRNIILETKDKIKQQKKQAETVKQLFENAESLYNQGKLTDAKSVLEQLLEIESERKEAKEKLKAIEKTLQEVEIQYKALLKEADRNLNENRFDAATSAYKEALKMKPNDEYCLKQLKVVVEKKKTIKPPLPPAAPKIVKTIPTTPPLAPPPPVPTKAKSEASSGTVKGSVPPPPPTNAPNPNSVGRNQTVPPPPPPINKKNKN